MKPVTIGRYDGTDAVGYAGWIETDDWIMFEALDGSLLVFQGRDASGAVQGEPTIIPSV